VAIGVLVHQLRGISRADQLYARRRAVGGFRGYGDVLCGLSGSRRSLQSIQVQRGVGTSTVGSPSFGGSINLESIAPTATNRRMRRSEWMFGTKTARSISIGALPAAMRFTTRSRRSVEWIPRIVRLPRTQPVPQRVEAERRLAIAVDRFTAHEWTQHRFSPSTRTRSKRTARESIRTE